MPLDEPSAIKAFISYSWSSPDHTEWVVELAEQLRADGIETILDVWETKEGDDLNAFMERMVTDPTVLEGYRHLR